MAGTAKKTKPKLWDKVKEEVTEGDKGGRPGQWSARKAQLATQEYKKEGGGYEGKKDADNHLQQWQDEDWNTKSGEKSGETGERYLPKAARKELSGEEYARSTRKKRADTAKGRQHSPQPADVARKSAKHRDGGAAGLDNKTKAELMAMARERGIDGRSRMGKEELRRALA
ncbi:MAG: hypothetical protein INR65_16955 [Gluconacetobacter diazotrophicus]|nr:hypothetical protein [Gluconacetobacter diazotrophicus]